GKWSDISCSVKKLAVCERDQVWTLDRVRQALVNGLKQFKLVLEEQQNELNQWRANPVPLGFVYVQLSGQPEPQILWPTVTFTELSYQYVGLFFRAQGDGAAPFGEIQAENAPRINAINVTWGKYETYKREISLPAQGWSDRIFTGRDYGDNKDGLIFRV